MKSMHPNDYGNVSLADVSEKISINKLVRSTKKELKKMILKSQIEAMGWKIEIMTSKTGFGGERFWFQCPVCRRRSGVLYKNLYGSIGCRICIGIKYRSSRFKGMIEEKIG